jgi:hypothetical protein
MWSTAPWFHSTQELHLWGCLAYGFVGKHPSAPNTAPHSRPGIFLGHSETTSGYLIYHMDTDTILTYGYVEAFPHRFPCRERQLAGEHSSTITDGAWRQWAEFRLTEVPDGSLSEFAVGKQLQVHLPRTMYPTQKGTWRVLCQRPIITKGAVVCMRLIFTHYSGADNDLSQREKNCLAKREDLWIDVPLSKPTSSLPKTIDTRFCLRDLLTNTFPAACYMHEFAAENVKIVGRYPVSSAIGTRPDTHKPDLASDTRTSSPGPLVTPTPRTQPPKLTGDRLLV